jgi:hypothetical protein
MRKTARIVVLAAALAAMVVAAGACSAGGSGDEAAAPSSAEPPAAPPAEAAEPAAEETSAPAPAEPAAEEPAARDSSAVEGELVGAVGQVPAVQPRVIQNASISLTVTKGAFEDAVNRARQIAASLTGFVTSSSSSQGPDQRLVRGSLVIRVPAQAYAQAMDRLADLGQVVGRQESGTDVSLQYVDLEARATHLEAVEHQLLGFLNQTKTVADALVVQQRLNDVQLQLEEIRGQLRYLDDQSSYATITIEIAERGVPVAPKPKDDGGWSLGDAWGAAVNGIEKIAGGALVVLVTAGPILALLALAALGGRALWRRRRVDRRPAAPPAGSPGL